MAVDRLKFQGDLELQREDDQPLHIQLRRIISGEIKRQRFPVDLKLPSERWFATKFNIDRVTVRRAFESLKEKGIIKPKSARAGVFVAPTARKKLKDPFPTIGIILPEKFSTYITRNEWRLRYLDGIIDQANELGYATMMFQPPSMENIGDDSNEDSYFKWKESLTNRLIGLIHFGVRDTKRDIPIEMLWDDNSLPQVVISGQVRNHPHIASLISDDSIGAKAAAEHLRESGHESVGVLSQHTIEVDNSTDFSYAAETRHLNISKVINSCGLETSSKWIFGDCKTDESVREIISTIKSSPDHPTALFCTNDQLARMVVDALEYLGYQVPDDMSVIGYNDSVEALGNPELSTIKQHFHTTGNRAVNMLVQMYEQGLDLENRNVKVPTSFVHRASVAPVAVMAY